MEKKMEVKEVGNLVGAEETEHQFVDIQKRKGDKKCIY